jgi:hypothetical protein
MHRWLLLAFILSWSLVIGTIEGLYTETSEHDLTHKGLRASDTPKDTAPQPFPASLAGAPSATLPSEIALADPSLASTATKREQLTYLVRCAMPEDIVLHAEQGSERFTFRGSMGLAPRWFTEML